MKTLLLTITLILLTGCTRQPQVKTICSSDGYWYEVTPQSQIIMQDDNGYMLSCVDDLIELEF